jgi:ribosome-associated protein
MARFLDIALYYIDRRTPSWRAWYTAQNETLRSGCSLEPADNARQIVDLLADRQAEDVLLLDIRKVADFADYFVIATASNSRHMRALAETLYKEIPPKTGGKRHEGETDSGWLLVDYGDVIVHLFSPELREHYALEELWSEATSVVRMQ